MPVYRPASSTPVSDRSAIDVITSLVDPLTLHSIEKIQDPFLLMPWLASDDAVIAEQAQRRWLDLAVATRLASSELLRPIPLFPNLLPFIDEYVEKADESALDSLLAVVGDAGFAPRIRFWVGRALTRRGHHKVLSGLIDALVQPDTPDWLSQSDFDWFKYFANGQGYDDRELA